MAERWLIVPSLPDYEVSDLGRVRRATPGRGTYVGKLLATPLDSGGYRTIGITSGPKRVHVLVAEAFLGPIPSGAEVHHRDEDRSNARLSNLEIQRSRAAHGERHRTVGFDRRREGESNPFVICACGCGASFEKYDRSGRPRRYVHGHNEIRKEAAARG